MSFAATRSFATSTGSMTPSTWPTTMRCGSNRPRASPSGSELLTFDARRCFCRVQREPQATSGRDDAVDDAVGDGLVGGHEVIAVDVVHHFVDLSTTVVRDDLGHAPRERQRLA